MRAARSGRVSRLAVVPWRAVLAAAAVLAVLGVALLPSPYALEVPGPVYDTLGTNGKGADRAPLIDIPDRTTYPATGRLDLLTVSVLGTPTGGPPWVDLAAAWLNPTQAVIPLEAIFPSGSTEQDSEREGAAEMAASQRSAVAAALRRLGYRVPSTVRVGTVAPRTAAAGRLRVGDEIESFAGRPVLDACALQTRVLANGTRPAAVTLRRDGGTRAVTVTPRRVEAGGGATRPLLGVATTASFDFPFRVRLRIDDVGGPSAGMMFALGIVDKLTPGSLTGGRHVAGTGTICGDGAVGPIGGIVQKMAAARVAGATLFLAPRDNCDEVVGHVPSGLTATPVSSLSDALDVLEQVRATGSTAGLPACGAPVESRG